MRSLGQFQTFFMERFHRHKKAQKSTKRTKSIKMHISEQKLKRQHFYALKKHLKGKKSLIRLFAFSAFCAFA